MPLGFYLKISVHVNFFFLFLTLDAFNAILAAKERERRETLNDWLSGLVPKKGLTLVVSAAGISSSNGGGRYSLLHTVL